MDMNIDIEVIKQARASKNWTQQQLAEICGLSLRTIQRIEKTGIASHESVASLSSAYEIEKQNFVISKGTNKINSNQTIKSILVDFCSVISQLSRFTINILAIALLALGVVGLINSPIDSRIWLLVATVFSSGVLITMSIMKISSCNGDQPK